jgi:hypothetical protein
MLENYGTARQATDSNIIQRMRFACWIIKATDINSEYVKLLRRNNQQDAVVKSEWEQFPLRLDYGRSPHAYVNQRLQIQLELLIMSGVPLKTC